MTNREYFPCPYCDSDATTFFNEATGEWCCSDCKTPLEYVVNPPCPECGGEMVFGWLYNLCHDCGYSEISAWLGELDDNFEDETGL